VTTPNLLESATTITCLGLLRHGAKYQRFVGLIRRGSPLDIDPGDAQEQLVQKDVPHEMDRIRSDQ